MQESPISFNRIRINPVLITALTTLFFAAVFILLILSNHAWDPRALILERPPTAEPGQRWGIGYDAQFYYKIAVDPTGAFKEMDLPAHRYLRIVFPMLARLFSLGNPEYVPVAMIGINLSAVFLGVYALGALAKRREASPTIAVFWVVSFGYLLALRLDMLEPLATGLAITGWWQHEKGNKKLAIALFIFAGLTKEIGLVIPLALGSWTLINRQWRETFIVWGGSFAPYFLWQQVLLKWEISAGVQVVNPNHLTLVPFSGFAANEDFSSRVLMIIWVIFPFVLVGLDAFWLGLRSNWRGRIGLDSLMVLAHVGFMSVLPEETWFDTTAVFRTTIGGVAVILLWLAVYRPRLFPGAIGLWLPLAVILFPAAGLI